MSDLRTELQKIYDQRGRLTPALVVESAKENPSQFPTIYSRLEWNDVIAGERYRLRQAGDLIRSVKIVIVEPDHDVTTRAFVAVRGPSEPSNYQPVETVTDPRVRAMILAQMRREFEGLKRRYDHLQEFWTMIDAERPPIAS